MHRMTWIFSPEKIRFYVPLIIVQSLSWGAMFLLWVFAFPFVRESIAKDEAGAITLVGLGLALYVSLSAALNFMIPFLAGLVSHRVLHAFALCFGGAGMQLIGHSHTQMHLLLGYAVIGVAWASISNIPYTLVTQRVQDDNYELSLARFNLAIVAPQIFIALNLGWVIHSVTPSQAVNYGSLAMFASAIVMLCVPKNKN